MNRVFIALLVMAVWYSASASEPVDTTYRRMPRTIVAVGGAAVLNIAVTEGLKHSVHELRPDRSENNSFPSRHTSWVFTASTVLSNELYHYSPWWSVAAQAASSAVGHTACHLAPALGQRCRRRRCYGHCLYRIGLFRQSQDFRYAVAIYYVRTMRFPTLVRYVVRGNIASWR